MKPGGTLFVAALLYLLLGCGAFFSQPLFLIWFLAGLGLLPVILADACILLFLTDRLRAEREIPHTLAQGEPVRVTLYISRASRRSLPPASVLLYDLHPDSMSAAGTFPAKLDCRQPGKLETLVFEYSLLPVDRGPWAFSGLDLLLGSPLRFWRLRVTHNVTGSGRTYPDFRKLVPGTAQGRELRALLENGAMREIRRRGQGMEFESLRDYHEGDSIRSIDWRATSRNRRLDGRPQFIVRDYQEERDQQVLFIIDSGYRLPDFQFDSALNAMLLLAYTALKHGDAVAAASFGASERWIPPRKGMSALGGLMNGLYDLRSAPVPSSPFSALETALARLRRRSFIVLISNFREEDGESLAWILPRIERRHLLLLVSFRESAADNIPEGETLERAAAFSYRASRRRLYRQWEHAGIGILETTAESVSAALINRYLAVKKSGKL